MPLRLLACLDASSQGLTETEARQLRQRHGPNQLTAAKPVGP